MLLTNYDMKHCLYFFQSGEAPPSPLDATSDHTIQSPTSDREDVPQGKKDRVMPVQSRIDARRNFHIITPGVADEDDDPGEAPPSYYP